MGLLEMREQETMGKRISSPKKLIAEMLSESKSYPWKWKIRCVDCFGESSDYIFILNVVPYCVAATLWFRCDNCGIMLYQMDENFSMSVE